MLARGVRDPRFGRPCSRLSRRGQQQAGELLPDPPGLSKCSCCLYSRGESQNGRSPPRSRRGGGLAGVAGSPGRGVFHPPGRLQPARTALSPSLCPNVCLVSLPCVFMRTLQCFSDALVCGSESFCVLPAGSSALARDVKFPFPCHIPLSLARRSAGDLSLS